MNEEQYKYLGHIELNNEVIHFGRDEEYIYSGILTNNGFVEDDEYKIDPDLSIDENINDFIQFIEEENVSN